MRLKKKILRKICGFLAVLMLVASTAWPVTVEAARLPYFIKINRQQNVVTIYKLDSRGAYTVPVKAMTCSTGVNNSTPTGTFTMSGKYRWHELMGEVYGQYCSRIHGGVLFHSVFYNEPSNPATLAYNSYNRLGTQASHGCVRLNVADAKWIYDNCPSGTRVTIYDSRNPGPLGKPDTIKIDISSPYRGWDPTDPNPGNPWQKMKPTFKGLKDRTIERCSKKPDLKKGVTATDYKGTKLKFTVSGKCNTKKVGKYRITYTAKDAKGSVTQKTITITVKDTKKPTVKVKKKNLTIKGELSEKKLLAKLRANVVAKDSGEKLAAKYITVNDSKLLKAMTSHKYGTYKVTVYAKDKAGNKSKKVTFKVKYVNPNPKEPDDPGNPDNPENPDDLENPDNPDNPDDPENPEIPDIPEYPDNPNEPVMPEEPDNSVDPDVPVNEDVSAD